MVTILIRRLRLTSPLAFLCSSLIGYAAAGAPRPVGAAYVPEPNVEQSRDYLAAQAVHRAARAIANDAPAKLIRIMRPIQAAFRMSPGFRTALDEMLFGTEACWSLEWGPGHPYGDHNFPLLNRLGNGVQRAEFYLQRSFPEKSRPLALSYALVDNVLSTSYSNALAWAVWGGEAFPSGRSSAAQQAACAYGGLAANAQNALAEPDPPLPPGEKRPSAKDVASWKAAAAALKKAGSLEPLLYPKTPLLKYAARVVWQRVAALKAKVNREWQAKLARMRAKRQQADQRAQIKQMLFRAQAEFQKRAKTFDALQVGPNSISKIMRLCGPAMRALNQLEKAMILNRLVPVGNHRYLWPPPNLRNIPNYAALKKDFPHTNEAVVCNLYWKMIVLGNWKPVRNYLAARHLPLSDPRVLYLDAMIKSDETMKIEAVKELKAYLKKHPDHPSLVMLEQQISGTWRPPPGN